MIGSAEMPWKVRTDFATFFPKFSAIADRHITNHQTETWQNWFAKTAPDLDPQLTTLLQSFTTAFETKRKIQSTNIQERNALYDGAPEQTVPLSSVMNANKAMCVETALLAKKFLDGHGVKSRVFSGEALFDYAPGDIHYPEAHTFLLIEHKDREFIYDPARPTLMADGRALFTVLSPSCAWQAQTEAMQNDCLMVAAENILTKKTAYYGVGDGGNVPESHMIHAPTAATASGRDRAGLKPSAKPPSGIKPM